ncbi:16S rRNA methyltransferase [Clostridia bacterium]|nr:16S rRNA methyltransferase [Clostridia bacterium]
MPDDGGYKISARYAAVAPECVERIIAEESRKYKRAAEVDRAVRNRLYQITGAYSRPGAAQKAFERTLADRLAELDSNMGEAETLRWCTECLAAHTSTRERLPNIVDFYCYIQTICAGARIVADYGCGLNPFALPMWKPIGLTRYMAYDVDTRLILHTNALLSRMGLPEAAQPFDLAARTPTEPADTALLLKLLPVLEAQRSGRGIEVLKAISSPIKVVSFPVVGLSGTDRARRIDGTAARFEYAALDAGFVIHESRRIGSEILYVIIT